MNKQKLKASLLAESKYIGTKADAEGRDLTAAEITRVEEIKTEVEKLAEDIARGEDTRDKVTKAFGADFTEDRTGPSTKGRIGGSIGSPLAKSIVSAIREAQTNTKAMTVAAGSVSVPANFGTTPLPRHPHLLSNVVQIVDADGTADDGGPNAASYLRQTGRTSAATTVERGGAKPESTLAFEAVNQKFATVAHTVTVPNQWLQDGGTKLAKIIEEEMIYGLLLGLDALLLNGGTDEEGNPVLGLLGTSGVLSTAFMLNPIRTIRRGIGQLEATGVDPSHVALSALDWENVDTATYPDEKYILADRPVGNADGRRIWNKPVALVEALTDGSAVIGDFANGIGLVSRGGIMLQWNPFSLDTTNETRLRVEGRFAPVIAQPSAFTVADLTEA